MSRIASKATDRRRARAVSMDTRHQGHDEVAAGKDLDDENQAFDALIRAFAEDYGDDETVSRLERMAQATGRWGELMQTANGWLQEQTEPARRIRLALRVGKWYGENLDHPEYAQPYYAMVMELDPNNVELRRRLAAIHRQRGNWLAVGEELTRALDLAVTDDDRKAVLHELGELLEQNLGRVEEGLALYRRALEVDPAYPPSLAALKRIGIEAGRLTAPRGENRGIPEGFFRDEPRETETGSRFGIVVAVLLVLCLVAVGGTVAWLGR